MGRDDCRDLRAVQRPALGSQLPGGQIWANPHFCIAVRTSVGGGVGDVWWRLLVWWRCGEELACESQSGRAMCVGQVSKLPDADETAGQKKAGALRSRPALSIEPFEGTPRRRSLWNLNCSCLETRHFQGTQKSLVHCQSRIRAVDHWHDDTTREAFVAEAEGEATSFKRRCEK